MIAKGSDKLKAYVGSTGVGKMYLGNTLVYSSSTEDTADYFALTASAASTIGVTGTYAFSLEYSLDKASWSAFNTSTTISLNSGETAYFRGNNTRLGSSSSKYTQFTMTGSLAASGNIASLLKKKGFESTTAIPNSYCFYRLFYGCSALTAAPVLPFTSCTSSCYARLFYSCSSINYIVMLATDISASGCLNNWVYGVASSGIFVKHIDATWTTTGNNGVPSGWTVIYYNPTTDKYYLSDKTTERDDHGNVV